MIIIILLKWWCSCCCVVTLNHSILHEMPSLIFIIILKKKKQHKYKRDDMRLDNNNNLMFFFLSERERETKPKFKRYNDEILQEQLLIWGLSMLKFTSWNDIPHPLSLPLCHSCYCYCQINQTRLSSSRS